MVKQFVYLDTASVESGDLVKLSNNVLRLSLNGLLMDVPPYAKVSLRQLQYISDSDQADGLILKMKNGNGNQMNLNKTDSVVAICPFEYTKGTNYHYKEPNDPFPSLISGNIQSLELYFANCHNVVIPMTNVSFCMVLAVESPDVDAVQEEYRKAMPL